MTRLDEIIANALAGIPETDVAILAREVVRLREARAMVVPALTDEDLNRYSMDCDERDAVEFGYNLAVSRIMPAGRVTIPPLTGGEIEARLLRLFPGIGEDDPLRESCFKDSRWAYNLAVSRARAIPADRVLGEGEIATRWIPVSESLPEDGESVGFVINSPYDEWNHRRAVGGRFNRKHFDKGFGGFSIPGIEWAASHWCKLPPIPDALRANQGEK